MDTSGEGTVQKEGAILPTEFDKVADLLKLEEGHAFRARGRTLRREAEDDDAARKARKAAA